MAEKSWAEVKIKIIEAIKGSPLVTELVQLLDTVLANPSKQMLAKMIELEGALWEQDQNMGNWLYHLNPHSDEEVDVKTKMTQIAESAVENLDKLSLMYEQAIRSAGYQVTSVEVPVGQAPTERNSAQINFSKGQHLIKFKDGENEYWFRLDHRGEYSCFKKIAKGKLPLAMATVSLQALFPKGCIFPGGIQREEPLPDYTIPIELYGRASTREYRVAFGWEDSPVAAAEKFLISQFPNVSSVEIEDWARKALDEVESCTRIKARSAA